MSAKSSQGTYWAILIVFVIIIVVLVQYNAGSGDKSANNSGQNQANSNTSQNSNQSQANDQSASNSSANQTTQAASAQEVINKFLKAISAGGTRSAIKNCSTSQFYATNFIQKIINGQTLGPDRAIIIGSGELTSTDKMLYTINESYNIENQNNAGDNGTYYYALSKINNSWLVSYRGEEKP